MSANLVSFHNTTLMTLSAQSHTHIHPAVSHRDRYNPILASYSSHTHTEPHTSLVPYVVWHSHPAYTNKRYAPPPFSPTRTTCSPHPSGLQPPCRVGFVCRTGGHSIQVDKCSKPQSGHSDPHSDRVPGCTSPLGSAKETFKVSAGREPRKKMALSLHDAPQVPPPCFWTLPPRTSDITHLTLIPSEALPAGAFKS